MGLFGGLGKRLKDGRLTDGLAAAQAARAGDAATIAQIDAAARQRREMADRRRMLLAAIESDQTLTPEAKAYGRADPEAFAAAMFQRNWGGFRRRPSDAVTGARIPPPVSEELDGYPEPGGFVPAQLGAAYQAPNGTFRWRTQ